MIERLIEEYNKGIINETQVYYMFYSKDSEIVSKNMIKKMVNDLERLF
jgi:hypothetical protein